MALQPLVSAGKALIRADVRSPRIVAVDWFKVAWGKNQTVLDSRQGILGSGSGPKFE
jgi:hypothetical protein